MLHITSSMFADGWKRLVQLAANLYLNPSEFFEGDCHNPTISEDGVAVKTDENPRIDLELVPSWGENLELDQSWLEKHQCTCGKVRFIGNAKASLQDEPCMVSLK